MSKQPYTCKFHFGCRCTRYTSIKNGAYTIMEPVSSFWADFNVWNRWDINNVLVGNFGIEPPVKYQEAKTFWMGTWLVVISQVRELHMYKWGGPMYWSKNDKIILFKNFRSAGYADNHAFESNWRNQTFYYINIKYKYADTKKMKKEHQLNSSTQTIRGNQINLYTMKKMEMVANSTILTYLPTIIHV